MATPCTLYPPRYTKLRFPDTKIQVKSSTFRVDAPEFGSKCPKFGLLGPKVRFLALGVASTYSALSLTDTRRFRCLHAPPGKPQNYISLIKAVAIASLMLIFSFISVHNQFPCTFDSRKYILLS